MPKLAGAVVVTDIRLSRYLYKQGWHILHHEMGEVEGDNDPSAIEHKFVVLGIPEDTLLEEMEKHSVVPIKDYEQRNVTRG